MKYAHLGCKKNLNNMFIKYKLFDILLCRLQINLIKDKNTVSAELCNIISKLYNLL